jgi:uncharacterized protein (TIGR03435 family)
MRETETTPNWRQPPVVCSIPSRRLGAEIIIGRSALVLLIAALAIETGQTQSRPVFDVVSIKTFQFPNDGFFAGFIAGMGPCGGSTFTPIGPRVSFGVLTVCSLIRMAYDVNDYQVVSIPSQMSGKEKSGWYQVEARAAPDVALTVPVTRLMLQEMLADRFKLKFHREPRQAPVYALVVAKESHKLGTPGPACENPILPYMVRRGKLRSCGAGITMAQLVLALNRESLLDRTIVDRTNLDGIFALSLEWSESEPLNGGDGRPSLFTAVQEQLGLKLERSTDAVDAFVIDYVEPPSAN